MNKKNKTKENDAVGFNGQYAFCKDEIFIWSHLNRILFPKFLQTNYIHIRCDNNKFFCGISKLNQIRIKPKYVKRKIICKTYANRLFFLLKLVIILTHDVETVLKWLQPNSLQ